jgi:LPPG:FO 2-phospho-L-lactate transferase
MITALTGGIGGAKLLVGLANVVGQQNLTAIINTGDDIVLHGLNVSPDLDIATYTLAGVVAEEKGWGIRNDSFQCLQALEKYTGFEWFSLGDRDLATHIYRTNLLRQGMTLTRVTHNICSALGVQTEILPMTDDKFETHITTKMGTMHFEEYMVKQGARDEVEKVNFVGAETAKPTVEVMDSIKNADLVIICPSNPVVSIGTILSVKGIRNALRNTRATKVAVSPIISGAPVKGPTDKLLRGLGLEVSSFAVAKLYSDFLDTFILDTEDAIDKERITKLGLKVKTTRTLMKNFEDKVALARTVVED